MNVILLPTPHHPMNMLGIVETCIVDIEIRLVENVMVPWLTIEGNVATRKYNRTFKMLGEHPVYQEIFG